MQLGNHGNHLRFLRCPAMGFMSNMFGIPKNGWMTIARWPEMAVSA